MGQIRETRFVQREAWLTYEKNSIWGFCCSEMHPLRCDSLQAEAAYFIICLNSPDVTRRVGHQAAIRAQTLAKHAD